MSVLRDYCVTLLAASVVGGVCAAVAEKPFARYVNFLTALCCVALAIAPIREVNWSAAFGGNAGNGEAGLTAEATAGEVETLAEERLKMWFSDQLFCDTGIKAEAARIEIDWSEQDPTIRSVTFAAGENDRERIKNWGAERFGIDVGTEAADGT